MSIQPELPDSGGAQRPRILIVEDNEVDAEVVKRILGSSRFEFATVERLSEAVQALTNDGIDAILLDLTLPDSSGLQTVRRVLEHSRGRPLIVITGHDDEHTALQALSEGAQDYLIKGKTDAQTIRRAIRYAFERARSEERVRASEERFRLLVENNADGISLLDRDGKVVYASPALTRILGYPPEEYGRLNVFDLVHPDDRAEASRRFEDVVSGKTPGRPMTLRYRHRNGSWRYLEVVRNNRLDDPAVRAIIVNFRDITDRVQDRQALERLLYEHELILNSMVTGVFGIDLNGDVEFQNPAAGDITGWKAPDLIGRSVHDAVHCAASGTPAHAQAECPVHAALAEGVAFRERADTFCRSDGSPFRADYVLAPKRDPEGRILGGVMVFRDVTHEFDMQQQIEQAARVSSLGRVAASVAHEFNNILMVIQPFADVLRRRIPAEDPLQRPITQIMDAVKRGKNVSQQILRYTHPAEPRFDRVDLRTWLRDLADEARAIAADRIVNADEADAMSVRADPGQLAQVMVNLVKNAREATAAGGTITLGASNASASPFVGERLGNAHAFAALFVHDDGEGIPPNVAEHIFEPLFTTKRGGGTGLGLAVAHQIVSQHGGYLLVDTTPGCGTTFFVVLPLTE